MRLKTNTSATDTCIEIRREANPRSRTAKASGEDPLKPKALLRTFCRRLDPKQFMNSKSNESG